MKKEKNTYITPLLTVVEFKTERGYAASVDVHEWRGWAASVDERIGQQVMMMNEDGVRKDNDAGDLTASNFSDGGYFGEGSGWNSDMNGTWF